MLSKNKAEVSLKKAFLWRFLGVTMVAWLIVSVLSYASTRHEIDELYDGEMAQIARVLLGIYSSEMIDHQAGTQITSSPFEGGDNYERKIAFQIWGENNTLLMRSANAPLEPLATQVDTFQTRTLYDSEMRTLSVKGPDGRLTIQVGQNLDIRRENAREILQSLLYIMLATLPILLLLIHRGLNDGIRSLNALSENIAKRTENNLVAIKTEDVPVEIRGIVDALNKLMLKMRAALERERHFISDAAHELRTPLAGIKAHAQLALKDKNHVQTSIKRIVEGVDRTTRLANQLLTLSGIEAMNRVDKPAKINIEALIGQIIQDLQVDISDKAIQIIARYDTQARMTGNEELIYILLRNLIDNAIRYSPPSSDIKIHCQLDHSSISVSVVDQGPGIEGDQRERVFDRFYRDINAQGKGSGLGLAIAKKIATLHQAEIILDSTETGKGLSATVIFNINHAQT